MYLFYFVNFSPGAHHVTWSTGNALAEVLTQQRHPDVEYRLLRHCLQNGYVVGFKFSFIIGLLVTEHLEKRKKGT